MGDVIIACEAKGKVIAVLTIMEHLSMLFSNWSGLARELEVDEVNIKTIRQNMNLETYFLSDAITAVVEFWVFKKGSAATLNVLVNALEKYGLKYIAERLEKEFGIGNVHNIKNIVGEETLFNDTLPESIPYYIPRTLISRNVLDIDKLFETAARINDVFCFTGIERFELSNHVKSTTDNSSRQIQMRRLSERYIILDSGLHFSKIEYRTNEPAHWIEFSQDDENREKKIVKWVQSSRNIEIIQQLVKFDSKQQQKLTEALILRRSMKNKNPICFSDCPGMGKSTILIKMGHKIKEMFPERIIVHFELRLFVNKMKSLQSSDNRSRFESALFQTLCKSGSSNAAEELNKIFCSDSVQIDVLFDGFDEIFPGDVTFCLKIIQDINALRYTRIWIASRPHFLEKIESTLNVLGYNIHSFTHENQIKFLSSYWLSQNQCLSPKKLTKLAEKGIGIISSQTKDQNFAGVPLRCFLIAQVFEETAIDFCTLEFEHQEIPDLLTITSTSDLFRRMIRTKLQKYYNTYGITKYGEGALTRMFMKLAMDLIFPGQLRKLNTVLESLDVSVSDLINTGLLLRQGAEDLNGAKFVHQTVAEYFCARYVADLVKQKNEEYTEEGKQFLFQTVLQLNRNASFSSAQQSIFNNPIDFKYIELFCTGAITGNLKPLKNTTTIETTHQKFNKCEKPFAHPVVCYFLNSFLSEEDRISIPGINSVCSMTSLKNKIWICMRNNFVNVFKLLICEPLSYNGSEIFDHDFLFVLLHFGQLDLVQVGFTYFEKFQKLDLELKYYILSHVGAIGNYSVFEYFCEVKKLKEILLDKKAQVVLDVILNQDDSKDSETVVSQKMEIIRYIHSVNPLLIKTIPVKTLLNYGIDLLCCLFELGRDVGAQDKFSGNTILHYIKHYRTFSEIHEIICRIPIHKFKRLVRIENKEGESILHKILADVNIMFLYQYDHSDMISLLNKFKKANTDFDSSDNKGNSLLMNAICAQQSVEIVKYLLKEGANPSHVNKSGMSVLFCWTYTHKRDISILDELIKAGCDVFRQQNGLTFLHSLLASNDPLSPDNFHSIVQILIANWKEKLLETESIQYPGLTPLQIAVNKIKMHKETVFVLKSVQTLNFDKLLEEERLNV